MMRADEALMLHNNIIGALLQRLFDSYRSRDISTEMRIAFKQHLILKSAAHIISAHGAVASVMKRKPCISVFLGRENIEIMHEVSG